MVFAYFKRADFTLEDYTTNNFFTALYVFPCFIIIIYLYFYIIYKELNVFNLEYKMKYALWNIDTWNY